MFKVHLDILQTRLSRAKVMIIMGLLCITNVILGLRGQHSPCNVTGMLFWDYVNKLSMNSKKTIWSQYTIQSLTDIFPQEALVGLKGIRGKLFQSFSLLNNS